MRSEKSAFYLKYIYYTWFFTSLLHMTFNYSYVSRKRIFTFLEFRHESIELCNSKNPLVFCMLCELDHDNITEL